MTTKTDRRSSSSTTPPSHQRWPQKFRGHTLEILGVLAESGGLTTAEIAAKTGLDREMTGRYCRRGYQAGILEKKERWGWEISPFGYLVVDINRYSTTTTTTAPDTNRTTTGHKPDTNRTPNTRQLDLTAFLSREDIDEPAREVVVLLSEHYQRTGEKYRYFQDVYQISEIMGISHAEVGPSLAHLKEEGCIYVRKESLGWKIGLKRAFVELLAHA